MGYITGVNVGNEPRLIYRHLTEGARPLESGIDTLHRTKESKPLTQS